MSRSVLVFVGASALTGVLMAGSLVEGCRGSSVGAGVGGSSGAGASSATSSNSATSSSAGNGGSPALDVTISQIVDPSNSGYVTNVQVRLTGVVATSIKFLVSKSSSSGACLWGIFVSAPGLTTTGPNTGLLVVDDGTPASTTGDAGKAYCPVFQAPASMPAGGLIPDDTAPGDVFDIVGLASSYVPSTCGAADAAPPDNSNVPEYQLTKLTSMMRTSTGGPVPTPAVLTAAEAMTLAGGTDATFLNQWGGVKVTVDNVQAELQQGMTFDSYGHMLMNDGLQIGDKLYYIGDLKATNICYNGPQFMSTTPSFTSVSGFVYLDYCTWGLDPEDKCHDFQPPSTDCADAQDGGTDAGPADICYE